MRNLKNKIIFLVGMFLLILLLGLPVNAANENLQLVKQSDTDFLIYINGHLEETFEFAFSNDETEPTVFCEAATDEADGGNYIAYTNQYTTGKYIWAKDSEDTYFVEGVELDFSSAIPKNELDAIQNVTNKIPVDTTRVQVEEKTVSGNKVTVTTGKVVFKNEGDYRYQIVKLPGTSEYTELMDLAERISKTNSEADMYKKIGIYTRFNDLYNKLSSELTDTWTEVENQEILQPEESENGDKYVLWINDGTIIDAQFLTSKYVEEKIVEKITTKLPVTYDNNILLVIFAILVIAIIAVSIRIKGLKEDK